ncbi:MAG: class I SAM-dependent methyltransferase [Nitrospirae bacterium]|nr:class I SAM-dependent methyltransferase [Nitrospirota bacterium]
MSGLPPVSWTEDGQACSARWRSEWGSPPPTRVAIASDKMTADIAYRLACEGTALLWQGDFQNARQLLNAMGRRVDRHPPKPGSSPAEGFHLQRQAQSLRARILGMLLVALEEDYEVRLRRAPDLRLACTEAYGPAEGRALVSLRELLGLIGAHEWRKKGLVIPVIGGRIYPHYGVFSPVRSEYVGLVAETPLRSLTRAFDIGTGTGVLAAVLARRGVAHIVATDQDPRALACARENLAKLGLIARVDVVQADLFPEGRAPLVVCNPPWVPARPSSPIEQAIYDPESRMLRGFLNGLAAHLEPGGEGWLLLSNLAEHLGLRTREELLEAVAKAGLKVIGKISVRPNHPKSSDKTDPLSVARAAELTTLWRLGVL